MLPQVHTRRVRRWYTPSVMLSRLLSFLPRPGQPLKIKHYASLLLIIGLTVTLYALLTDEDLSIPIQPPHQLKDLRNNAQQKLKDVKDTLFHSNSNNVDTRSLTPQQILQQDATYQTLLTKYHTTQQQYNKDNAQYDVTASNNIAFCIPVGGQSERSKLLDQLIQTLLSGGAKPSQIYIVEDVLSRSNQKSAAAILTVVQRYKGINHVATTVDRSVAETADNYGIHLARHYHQMLDYILYDAPLTDSHTAGPISSSNSKPNDANDRTRYNFAVIIENDLIASPDLVKYFYEMSRVMRVDSSIYCVSAHQDNAFLASSYENNAGSGVLGKGLKSLDFDFRRGNHFMAPGWMISSQHYNQRVRPQWMDSAGEYTHKSQLHLRNGHWDRFFDSLTGDLDCIFPAIPRIYHQGSDGFTVNQKVQDELYSNIRLSQIKSTVSYGDLTRLTKEGYQVTKMQYIAQAKRLTVLEEIKLYSKEYLLYTVPAQSDSDPQWNVVMNGFFGVIGVGGYGGHEGYVKQRGVDDGVVFMQYLTNNIMLVAMYSSLYNFVQTVHGEDAYSNDLIANQLQPEYTGCYIDDYNNRDLPQYMYWYQPAIQTPNHCLLACHLHGYTHAGLQNGGECWCGGVDSQKRGVTTVGKHGKVDDSECSEACADGKPCGAANRNSVYTSKQTSSSPAVPASKFLQPAPHSSTQYLLADPYESCTDACKRKGKETRKNLQCNEQWFPLIYQSGAILSEFAQCDAYAVEEDSTRGLATPSVDVEKHICYYGRASTTSCKAEPQQNIQRMCVCVKS